MGNGQGGAAMNIGLKVKVQFYDADLDNLGDSLESIEEGCLEIKRRLTDELLVQAELRQQYLDRLIRFCHTGK
jgi:hypothetical protein